MRVALAPLVCVGCFHASPPAGAPCGDGGLCPAHQHCAAATSTCEFDDEPGGPIDVTGGGTFATDIATATDSLPSTGCSAGGRDVFYRVRLAAPEVYYFDTLGTSFATALRVFDQPCATVGSGDPPVVCAEASCGGEQSQVALSLPAGDSCIVVDAVGTAAGDVVLQVIAGGRDAAPLLDGDQVSSGNTCGAENLSEPDNRNCDGPGSEGRELAYFLTTCPGQARVLDASMCPEPRWDPVLYLKSVDGDQLACNDDDCGAGPRLTGVDVSGALLYFLFVDGFDAGECGDYDLATSLR